MTLTTLEKTVLRTLIDSSAGNGHDFGFIEDARPCVGKKSQLSGVVSSLVQKGVLEVYDPVRGEDGYYTQFKFKSIDTGSMGREQIDAALAQLEAEAA